MNQYSESTGRWRVPPAMWLIGGMVAVMLLSNWLIRGRGASGEAVPVSQRRMMASLSMADLDGKMWRTEDQRGKVVLVNYWATWCPPCQRETPELVNVAKKYANQGVSVVGVSLDEGEADGVRRFVARYGIPYPILKPEAGSPHTEGISSIPVTLLLDRQGRVARTYLGAVTEKQLSGDIDDLLKETM